MLVGCGIHGIDFVARDHFTVFRYAIRQERKYFTDVHLTVFQTIVHTLKLPPKWLLLAQGYRRTHLACHGQGVDQVEQTIRPLAQTLVYCFSELADVGFLHTKTLSASSIFVKVPRTLNSSRIACVV